MKEPMLEDLTQRVDRLERETRGWKRGAAVLAVGVAAVVLMGQARPAARVVEAERFVLLDSGGRIRGILGTLVQDEREAGLYFYDRGGKERAGLVVRPDGMPVLHLNDRDEKPRAYLAAVGPDGAPRLDLYDTDRRGRASLVVLPDTATGLLVFDRDGNYRGHLTLGPGGVPALGFFQKDGKVIWSAP